MTGDAYRNCDGHWLVLSNCEEVYVESLVGYRMPLSLVKDACILLAIVEYEVDDVRVRGVGYGLEILCVNGEENVLDSVSIKVARYETFSADCLYGCLVANLTELAFEFNVLHCC